MPRISTPIGVTIIALCAVAAVALAVTLIDTGESAGPEDGITLRQIAENPEEYDGRRVTISGEFAESEYLSPADADVVFPIGDDADQLVLVLPQEGVDVPDLTEDTVVRVVGVVRAVAPNEATTGGAVDQGGLLARSGAQATIEASRVTIPGGDVDQIPNDPPARTALIDQLLEDPAAWDERPVLVPGTVAKLGDNGFVLADEGSSIFVSAPSGGFGELAVGERVRIRAELERLSEFRADTVAEALSIRPEPGSEIPEGVDLARTPSEVGDAFLLLRTIRPPAGA